MVTAALYETTIRHVRTAPVTHRFRNRSCWWLVDLDDLPVLPRPLRRLAEFRAADHLGSPELSLRDNVQEFCEDHGIDLAGGRVLMLANARVLGHVFNPLSVFWCHAADGTLACVLAEVHNTYGGRHTYLVETDGAGRAVVDKAFYVSPFHPVDGSYTMNLPEPDARLDLVVTLHRPDSPPFVASVRGERRPATVANIVRAAVRHPAETRLVSVRIRLQGIALWLKRLPVQPRPAVPPVSPSARPTRQKDVA
ncbi:MAG: hypothetical protein JWL64_2536 [Frankiales bacterium]|nr:hypothetical protein [Frankiales bacterium]